MDPETISKLDGDAAKIVSSSMQELPLQKIIGEPLSACVKAQAEAAATSYNYIRQLGFDENGETVTVSFSFVSENRKVEIQVPLITLVPLPFIQIDTVDISFRADMSADGEGNITAKYSNSADSTATRSSKYNVQNQLDIKIKASSSNIPAGMLKILEVLSENCIAFNEPPGEAEMLDEGGPTPNPFGTQISFDGASFLDGDGNVIPPHIWDNTYSNPDNPNMICVPGPVYFDGNYLRDSNGNIIPRKILDDMRAMPWSQNMPCATGPIFFNGTCFVDGNGNNIPHFIWESMPFGGGYNPYAGVTPENPYGGQLSFDGNNFADCYGNPIPPHIWDNILMMPWDPNMQFMPGPVYYDGNSIRDNKGNEMPRHVLDKICMMQDDCGDSGTPGQVFYNGTNFVDSNWNIIPRHVWDNVPMGHFAGGAVPCGNQLTYDGVSLMDNYGNPIPPHIWDSMPDEGAINPCMPGPVSFDGVCVFDCNGNQIPRRLLFNGTSNSPCVPGPVSFDGNCLVDVNGNPIPNP